MDKKEIYKKALKIWGIETQIMMVVEECSELLFTISKWMRGKYKADKLVEEIADVEIMLEQLKIIAGISDTEVQSEKNKKIQRLEDKLKNIMEVK